MHYIILIKSLHNNKSVDMDDDTFLAFLAFAGVFPGGPKNGLAAIGTIAFLSSQSHEWSKNRTKKHDY